MEEARQHAAVSAPLSNARLSKSLIADRGEIACRVRDVARTAHRTGDPHGSMPP